MRIPRGLDRDTFEIVEGWPYVEGLLIDVFGTRVGLRVLRRWYGSDVPNYIDAPGNRAEILALLADIAAATDTIRDLETGEPVVRFTHASQITAGRDGQYGVLCHFDDLFSGQSHEIALERLRAAA
ncbi:MULTISPECIES: hypothetical protein [unclassified Shinella]|uniref:hypothetical protein n=1 Tax=unclassified Shinella TaxID=2643062 RepID=UPI00225CF02B|nr:MULTISPECIES: hypothetical protein [unclassified Shinella]MCO5138992.1 hypothetical protein [Shinella sp.]MDC7256279.1 hypothetical protein [Shinella sp. YE25]CAI0339137.1 conserved hypothetical protein [Rhizobiaceae bacterium]CAK7257552.1 IraD/Gp25-like domain-containing protein [Shinella sp. WSC3-e]